MSDAIKNEMKSRMQKTVEALKKELVTVRAGRANPALLDKVMVDYYGSLTPLKQLANIATPEPRLLTVQPYDKSALANMEKAILKAELGLTPTNDGNMIRIAIPALTEERRRELVKQVKKYGEESKVVIRNIRRDANDALKKLEKDGEISEDDSRRLQDEVQKETDQYIKQLDDVVANKEKEILEV
ncbi:ribosome recycling factor [Rubeoparvulum massiliense]|uniref:ribosome recycling factor n=1 Tax=Rubeoparvulum massiliense TaxID=1631346 RepID=UPI00065E438E|nr:ribosome recycling factor [Rubeoparvulum massiliense]